MVKHATNGAGSQSEFDFDGLALEDLIIQEIGFPPTPASTQKIARAMQIPIWRNFRVHRELSRVVMKYKARKRDGQLKDNLTDCRALR